MVETSFEKYVMFILILLVLILGFVVGVSDKGSVYFNNTYNNVSNTTVYNSSGSSALASRPACDSTMRGFIWINLGGLGVADTVSYCLKTALDTYAWT